MKTYLFLTSLLAATWLLCGCEDRAINFHDVPHRVVDVEKGDEAMDAAILKAKATFGQFEQNWQRTDLEGYSIKFAMKTNVDDDLEYIWFTPTKIDQNEVTATCANDPANIPGLRFGDVRTVNRSAVSDWMILANGKCYGGYTIRVLSERDPASAPELEFADFPEPTK